MTWMTNFPEYSMSPEVKKHKRRKTYGGTTWPRKQIVVIAPDRQMEIALAALAAVEEA